jgi:hypothetical protein
MERMQVIFSFIREISLGGIYISKTTTMLRNYGPLFKTYIIVNGKKDRKC